MRCLFGRREIILFGDKEENVIRLKSRAFFWEKVEVIDFCSDLTNEEFLDTIFEGVIFK